MKNYTIAGDNDCPLIHIRLREDETVRKDEFRQKGDRRDVQRDRQIADQR